MATGGEKSQFRELQGLGTTRLGSSTKAGMVEADPVSIIDNQSIHSNSAPELLTISDVARLLKISASGVRRLQQGRLIPFFKVGGSVRFATSDIAAYLASHRIGVIE